jgi:hypothetical protein
MCAARAVLSASGAAELEKFTKHQHGIDLITSARGARSLLTLSSFSTEWRLIRKAVLPAFSLAAVRRRFERDILPSAEAGAEAVVQIWRAKRAADDAASADAAALAGGESSSPSPPRETTTTSVSVDVTELAVTMAMEVTTSLGFGLRSNVVERWGAAEASKIITAATARQQEQGLDQDDNDAADADPNKKRGSSLPAPPAVPRHLIEGAEDTIEALSSALSVAQSWCVRPPHVLKVFAWTSHVREGMRKMGALQRCISAVAAAAGAAADTWEAAWAAKATATATQSSATGGGGGGGREEKGNDEDDEGDDETVFSRLRAIAPEAAAASAAAAVAAGGSAADAENAAEVLLRESGFLYVAAIDTTSHTLAFTLALLAAHPEAMKRVESELESRGLLMLEDGAMKIQPPRKLEFADLSRSSLPFLHACLMESMRLVPAAAGGTLRTVGPGGFELSVPEWREEGKGKTRTVVIPEGCQLWIPFYLIHRAEEFWGPDAAKFKSERFLDLNTEGNQLSGERGATEAGAAATPGGETGAKAPTAAAARRFLPFSRGARGCIGQNLARTSLIAELAALLGRLSFSLDRSKMGGSLLSAELETRDGVRGVGDGVFKREGMNVMMTVKGGVWLLATPRGTGEGASAGAGAGAAGARATEE